MNDIESKVEALIRRKHLIDDMVVDRFTETQRWLVDSVELLLLGAQVARHLERNLADVELTWPQGADKEKPKP